ncbi:MAG: YecA family protein [Chthoniobacteraceae bacterium]
MSIKPSLHTPLGKAPNVDPDRYNEIVARNQAAVALQKILRDDFWRAWHEIEAGDDPYKRRAVVRCFGSMADGTASSMREIACNVCEMFGNSLNPFLQEKVHERSISTYQRMVTSYRLVEEFLPGSPLSKVTDERWQELKEALAVRNRIVHPTKAEDLEVAAEEIKLLVETAYRLFQDTLAFYHWCAAVHQRMGAGSGLQRKAGPKVGRNDRCPCASGLKYKNCCGKGLV